MKTILQSPVKPSDGVTAPLRVTLSLNSPGAVSQFATHLQNMQDGGKFNGRYHSTMEAAGKDYSERCKALGVSERDKPGHKPNIIVQLSGGLVEAVYVNDPSQFRPDAIVIADPGDSEEENDVEVKDGPFKGLIVYQDAPIRENPEAEPIETFLDKAFQEYQA